MDFTCSEDVSEDVKALLDGKNELDFSVTGIRIETTVGDSRRLVVKYRGFNSWPNNVRIDLSLRESVQVRPANLTVLHNYDELPAFSIPSMSKEEIMAEKVRAVIYSGAPRHLYDLNYLLGKQVCLDPELVQTKTSLYGHEFSLDRFREGVLGMEKRWVGDLRSVLPQAPPPFKDVSTVVLKKIPEVMKK